MVTEKILPGNVYTVKFEIQPWVVGEPGVSDRPHRNFLRKECIVVLGDDITEYSGFFIVYALADGMTCSVTEQVLRRECSLEIKARR